MEGRFPKVFSLSAPVKMGRNQAGPQVPLTNDEKASDTFPNLGMGVLLDKIVEMRVEVGGWLVA